MSALDNLRVNTRKLMEAHGLSQAELAKRAGISQRSITHILSTTHPNHAPNLETIEAIATALRMKVECLLSDSEVNVTEIANESPALVARQVGRLVENFLASSPEGRRAVLEYASTQAEATFAKGTR